jgi:hypothetical protein
MKTKKRIQKTQSELLPLLVTIAVLIAVGGFWSWKTFFSQPYVDLNELTTAKSVTTGKLTSSQDQKSYLYEFDKMPNLKVGFGSTWDITSTESTNQLGATLPKSHQVTLSKNGTLIKIATTMSKPQLAVVHCYSNQENPYLNLTDAIRSVEGSSYQYWRKDKATVKETNPTTFATLVNSLSATDAPCKASNSCQICISGISKESMTRNSSYILTPSTTSPSYYTELTTITVTQATPDSTLLTEADNMVKAIMQDF